MDGKLFLFFSKNVLPLNSRSRSLIRSGPSLHHGVSTHRRSAALPARLEARGGGPVELVQPKWAQFGIYTSLEKSVSPLFSVTPPPPPITVYATI